MEADDAGDADAGAVQVRDGAWDPVEADADGLVHGWGGVR